LLETKFDWHWKLSDQQARTELDIPGTIAHNALIDSINILANFGERTPNWPMQRLKKHYHRV